MNDRNKENKKNDRINTLNEVKNEVRICISLIV